MPETIELDALIADLNSKVDDEMKNIICSRDMTLYQMMSYHMGWTDRFGQAVVGGNNSNRIHGLLCALISSAMNLEEDVVMPAAASVELVSSFAEMHDDIQSGNPVRDERDAVWWLWGPAQAINAGDGMHAMARLAMCKLVDKGISSEITLAALRELDHSGLEACEGRFIEMESQDSFEMTIENYLNMASLKTGSLFGCAMQLGAIVSSNYESMEDLKTVGEHLGISVQINSDIDSLWGTGAEFSPDPDLLNKKKLFPIVYGLNQASISEKRALGEIYFKRVLDKEDAIKVRNAIDALSVKGECQELVVKHFGLAESALEKISMTSRNRQIILNYMSLLVGNNFEQENS